MTTEKLLKFEDLEFKPRKSQGLFDYKPVTCMQATKTFENGYMLSVLTPDETGRNKYCQANKGFYEIAILRNGKMYYGYSDKDRNGDGKDEYDLDQDYFEGVWTDQPKEKVEELLNVVSNFPIEENVKK
jgi:hypothetical protein